jgi:hypothetical protein
VGPGARRPLLPVTKDQAPESDQGVDPGQELIDVERAHEAVDQAIFEVDVPDRVGVVLDEQQRGGKPPGRSAAGLEDPFGRADRGDHQIRPDLLLEVTPAGHRPRPHDVVAVLAQKRTDPSRPFPVLSDEQNPAHGTLRNPI